MGGLPAGEPATEQRLAPNEIAMLDAFTGLQWSWVSAGALLLLSAVIFYLRGNVKLSIALLALGACVLRLLMINTDPFLYDWDEQYHALVAQHLAVHPGTPTLYDDPQLPVDIKEWAHNHIWLHKPPLFLWLIALSVKIFGATPFAVKLPSVILSSLMIPSLFSIVRRVSTERAGFIAALLLAAHSYSIQLISGFRNTDHNDIIFAAFVLFSFQAWMKYTETNRQCDAIATGLLVGCAVLVKWLPGILVFLPWGLWILRKQYRKDKVKWIHLSLAVLSAMILVLPWYVHIYSSFPAEAEFEMHYNMLHFTVAMEGHEGPWYYHFDQIRELMGWTMAILAVPGILLFALHDTRYMRTLYTVIAVLFFFIFYAVAKTKMPLFMLPVIPLLLAGIAVLIDKGLDVISRNKAVVAASLTLIFLFVMDVRGIVTNHSSLSELAWYRDEMWGVRNKADFYLKQKANGPDAGRRVVMFNFPENERAAFMFYTGDIVYNQAPPLETLRAIQAKGFVIGAYENQMMPEEYRSDSTIRLYFGHLAQPAQ